MGKRISEEIKAKIEELAAQGYSPKKIATKTGVSKTTVNGLIKTRQRTNPETGQLFTSYTEYQKYLVTQKINPETGQPFTSYTEYQKYLVTQKINPETEQPFQSLTEYQNYLAKKRIDPETGQQFKSRNKYQNYRARKKVNPETRQPFESRTNYENYLATQRQKKPRNKELSDRIKEKLEELEKTQAWLAKQIGTSRESISKYTKGKAYPRAKTKEKIYQALQVPYETIDDRVQGN